MTGSNPSRKQKENIRLYRLNDLPQVELFQGVNIKRSFSRHRHWVFSISVVEKGNRIYHYRGKEYLAGPGDVKVICPGESHATGPADQQAYSMRAIRLEEAYFNSLTDQITRKGQPLTSFPQPLINDPDLFNQVINLYELLSGDSSRLEKEYSLVDMLTGLLIKYAPEYYTEAADVAIMPMKAIGDYICDHCHENISLIDLGQKFSFCPYHLVHQFTLKMGVPPHVFLVQARFQRALKLLADGLPVAAVAAETGFYDQSHFTHAFEKKYGITPNQYKIDSKKNKPQ